MPPVHLVLLAGSATAPAFLDEAAARLRERIRRGTASDSVTCAIHFPYGDWSRGVIRQLLEIRHDTRLPIPRFSRSIGGRFVLRRLHEEIDEGWVVLVGHSGGGIAGLHAAALMTERRPELRCAVVQIGSPRSPVPRSMAPSVAFFYASGGGGRSKDPITRLGSWGGWTRSLLGVPAWDRRLHQPGFIRALPLAGGHADYFRTRLTAADGRTNLQVVEDEIWQWLESRFRSNASI
jgi:hypothetical protein